MVERQSSFNVTDSVTGRNPLMYHVLTRKVCLPRTSRSVLEDLTIYTL